MIQTEHPTQNTPVHWAISHAPVSYPTAMAAMDARVAAIGAGRAAELVWLLEHPPLYTAGTSAHADDLLAPDRFPVHKTGRGGQYTYHGPGQRVVYVMLDLTRRKQDVRWFVRSLEDWLIATLAEFGVRGARRDGLAGVWVSLANGDRPEHAKIAALGVRLRRWVSFHGISLNVAPNLAHFSGIVPCGVSDAGVTSLAALGVQAGMSDVDAALRLAFEHQFGCVTADAPDPLTTLPTPPSPLRPNP